MAQENGDHEMADATAGAEVNGSSEAGDFTFERQRLRVLPNSTDSAASFAFENEDHTLGNALRYLITKNPDVEFCGYSIPHPSETIMNLRIQIWGKPPASLLNDSDATVYQVLEKALDDLTDVCDAVEEKFTTARDDFNATNPDRGKA